MTIPPEKHRTAEWLAAAGRGISPISPTWHRASRHGLGAVLVALGILGGLPPAGAAPPKPGPKIEFDRDIRPLLSDRCFACHGPDAQHRQADLRLDQEQAAKDSAIVPSQPDDSELLARITSQDPELRMPPPDSGKTLSAAEIERLRSWIAQGAAWSEHWAYVPPVRHAVPNVSDTSWPINWIDRFLLARLEAAGVKPSPDADRVTLIRRLSFDLTGLPPTPEQVAAFVEDADPLAYEKLVDRLLESPHFGERLAMYWLDLVRFADTVGYHGDQDHNISPYRDWVIDAFNDNLPFDQFTRAQLAGDLLPDSTIDDKIASGYNRLLQTSHEGGVQEKEYLAIYAADRVRNVSSVWLGGTMGCCQCHDHKFDPYTAKDFYSLAALFADVDETDHLRHGTNDLPTARKPELRVLSRRQRQQLAQLDARAEELQRAVQAATNGAARKEAAVKAVSGTGTEATVDPAVKALRTQLDEVLGQRQKLQNATRLTMVTQAIEPRTMRILPRGNWLDDSGPVVEPAVPEFLGRLPVREPRASRLDLANWLTDIDQGIGGLTARVQVNRLWYLMFGGGLAPVLDDFGGQGQPPSHPRLLDNLTWSLIDHGWNVKHMIKLLVMSRAYRQASRVSPEGHEADPFNRLLARQARYRLPAEMVRDNALSISGLLVHDLGGRSVRPYQPEGYYRHLNFPTRTYHHDADNRQWRRGVYVHWQRQFLHPMLRALDAPTREECTAQRTQSNTPLAALTLLNDPSFVEAARVFAERIVRQADRSTDARLDYAFLMAVSRLPDATERAALSRLLDVQLQEYARQPEAARQLIQTGQAPVPKDLLAGSQAAGSQAAGSQAAADRAAGELAAWTGVARVLLNLNETITRN